MEVIIMKSGSFRALMDKIEAIEKHICHSRTESEKPPLQEIWLDNKAVCTYLKISKRTLQRYRSNGVIAYSLVGRKTYYTISEIKGCRLLDNFDLCQMLNVSKRTVKRYRSSSELPFQMIYHKTYYKESDVIAFIEKHFSSFRNINKKGNK